MVNLFNQTEIDVTIIFNVGLLLNWIITQVNMDQ